MAQWDPDARALKSDEGGQVRWHAADKTNFVELMVKNSFYVIHPEEILADNFSLLLRKDPRVQTQWVIDKLREALSGK